VLAAQHLWIDAAEAQPPGRRCHRAILLRLALATHRDGVSCLGWDRLIASVDWSRRRVSRALTDLREEGYIAREQAPTRGRPAGYRVLAPSERVATALDARSRDPRGARDTSAPLGSRDEASSGAIHDIHRVHSTRAREGRETTEKERASRNVFVGGVPPDDVGDVVRDAPPGSEEADAEPPANPRIAELTERAKRASAARVEGQAPGPSQDDERPGPRRESETA
jgi:hypothetical protein